MKASTLAFVVTAFICLSIVTAHSVPSHLWSKRFGSTGFDIGYAVGTDASDNVYVAGYFNGTVDFGGGNLMSAGSDDVFLAKYDVNGAQVWSKRFGSTGFDDAYGLAVDASGNVVVIGRFEGTVDFGSGAGLVSAGSTDIFVAKYNSAGVHQWSKRFGSTQADAAHAVALDGLGNVLMTGVFRLTVDFGGGNLSSSGFNDVIVAKFDANGTHVWSQRFGSTLFEAGNTIAVDGSNNVIVGGQFQGTVSFGGAGLVASSTDMFLAKYNSAGVHQWSVDFGGTGGDLGKGVAVDGSGNVYYTGLFEGTVNFGGGAFVSLGASDIFLAKYNSAGAHQWSDSYGSALADEGRGVAADAGGNVTLTGEYQGTIDFGGGNLTSAGTRDVIVATYDATGAHQWSQSFGAGSDDTGNGVAIDGSDNLLVIGLFRNTVDFGGGGGGLTSAGEADIFVFKYGTAVTGVETPQQFGLVVSSYPNPFNPRTTVSYTVPSSGPVTVAIYDASGAHVATLVNAENRAAGDHRVEWDGRSNGKRAVSSGVYFVRVDHAGRTRASKMVLLK